VNSEVRRFHARIEAGQDALVVVVRRRDEAEPMAVRHDLLQPDESPAADEEHIRRVEVLAAAQAYRRAFHDL
jgi:hypothetical protein